MEITQRDMSYKMSINDDINQDENSFEAEKNDDKKKTDEQGDSDDDVIQYSSNDVFLAMTHKDESGEIIGYIDEVTAPQEVGNGPRKFRLMKFTVNNDDGKRITCLLWGSDIINKFKDELNIHRIVHIERGYIKTCKTFASRDSSLVPFEMVIQLNTTIEYLRYHVSAPSPIASPIDVDFKTIQSAVGPIRIKGYVKTNFITSQKFNSTSTYGSGAITDGEYKITVNIAKFTELKIDKGSFVTVRGEVRKGDGPIVIMCNESSDIVVETSKKKMSRAKLMQGIATPKRSL